ncbi:MAG: biotin transporter BioY [Acidobacteria bacterium]|nr:biotin transporter BioY [Acidobacteriota bacterium]
MPQIVSCATLVDRLAERRDARGRTIRGTAMVFITALTAAAAQISVPLPFTEVPFTLQPMVVLLGGLALGSRLALGSQVLYLMAGIAGLPVFASSVTLPPGALRLLGPTGGYLLAYPMAAFLVGYLAERGFDRRYLTSVLAMLAGLAMIYGCGALWLGFFARPGSGTTPIGLQAALVAGVYPFIVADLVKLLAAAGILPAFWRLLGRTDHCVQP